MIAVVSYLSLQIILTDCQISAAQQNHDYVIKSMMSACGNEDTKNDLCSKIANEYYELSITDAILDGSKRSLVHLKYHIPPGMLSGKKSGYVVGAAYN